MTKVRYSTLAFVLFILTCTVSCTSNSARTYYDSLSLDSPEHAVESFISAYQRSDFQTVYLILSPRAQRTWQENYSLLNWPAIIHIDTADDPLVIKMIDETAIANGQFEHSGETSYEFDEIMMAAQKLDLLIVDLSGTTKIRELVSARDTIGNPATDVFVTSSQYDADLIFRTVQAPSGKWRVYQVFLPGGSEDFVPWAMPTEGQ